MLLVSSVNIWNIIIVLCIKMVFRRKSAFGLTFYKINRINSNAVRRIAIHRTETLTDLWDLNFRCSIVICIPHIIVRPLVRRK